mmetsp:Transcript_18657/g.23171  ORF Transcript_18657/g.23171 Transcript_18657/m.23171 type:complete len:189 (+) Transcript_18657:405-971(+)
MVQKAAVPPTVESVSSSRASWPNFSARKNKKPASLTPQRHTAAHDNVTRGVRDAPLVINGRAADTANAPVPSKSRWRCEPVARLTRKPSALIAPIADVDCQRRVLSKMGEGGIMWREEVARAPPLWIIVWTWDDGDGFPLMFALFRRIIVGNEPATLLFRPRKPALPLEGSSNNIVHRNRGRYFTTIQ